MIAEDNQCKKNEDRSSFSSIRLVPNVRVQQEEIRAQPPRHLGTKLKLPDGAPMRKGWYVGRQQIVQDMFDRLCRESPPKLAALVGESGSGKTTVAVEIIMDVRVQQFFSNGIVWLSVDDGAYDRLPTLMTCLAGKVDKNMSQAQREYLINSGGSANYI